MSQTMSQTSRPASMLLVAVLGALALSACGGGSSSSDPPAQTYSLSATISGLDSSGLVLSVDGASVSVTSGTSTQVLAASLASGTQYSVTVAVQPTGQTCSVAGGSGTIGSANVANVVVTCSDQAYSLGGSITGLGNDSGLVLANGSDTLSVTAGATSFTLPTPVAYTSSYDVTVQSSPAGLACSVSNPSGTMPAAAVTDIQVSCTDQSLFSLGGAISGLGENTGLVLANGSSALLVTAGATSFTMPTDVGDASPYDVIVQSEPSGLICTPSNNFGTMPAANINNILITCSDQSYTLGGSISGLISNGLVLANGTDTEGVSSGSNAFNLPTPVAYGGPYDVTVQTQPSGLTCTPSNNVGSMPAGNVTGVTITCSANTYTVGGTISGLETSGLVLLDNGGDATTIDTNAIQFSMSTGMAYGAAYDVTVQSEPTGLVCTVSNGAGTVGGSDVSSISIACVSNTTILYSFSGNPSLGGDDGAYPLAGLIQASDGSLYGTTVSGGSYNCGTAFGIALSGTETFLHSFTNDNSPCVDGEGGGGGDDGGDPRAALIQISDGSLYGTTPDGGAHYVGTVFQITPSGTESVVYSFAGGTSDGVSPQAGLIQGSDGNLYGTTSYGGTNSEGTVFKINPSTGAESIVYSFAGGTSDGAYPEAGLIQGSDGNLYGTTANGGASGDGTVFEVDPSTGAESIVYSFAGGTSDGAYPAAGVIQGSDGNLYGTTANGGANGDGTVFEANPNTGAETIVYSFAGGASDGANPYAGLIQASDGNFYGTTANGGINGDGTVFEISSGRTESILHSFTGGSTDGANPYAGLIQGSDGNLYGTTRLGGTDGVGTVFKTALQ